MKSIIHGYSQKIAHKNGVTLKELCFLDWFHFWYNSRKMHGVYTQGNWYGWVDREYVMRQIPLLGLTHPDSVTRLVTNMVKKGLLDRLIRPNEGKRGTRLFIKPGPLLYALGGGDEFDNAEPPPQDDDYQTESPAKQDDQQTQLSAKDAQLADATVCSDTTTKIYTTPVLYTGASDAGKPASVEDTPLTELSEEDRELYHILKASFLSQVTGGKFTNWPKESKGLKRLLRYSTTFAVDNRSDWLQALLEAFLKLVEGHDRFWSNQPFLPSVLASDGIFPRVHKEMMGSIKDKAVADYMTKNNLW